jgi:hypothetical protein
MRLPQAGAVESVVLFPRNGLINRIQAMASTQLLGDALSAPMRTCWTDCGYLTTPADEVFDSSFVNKHFTSVEAASEQGIRVKDIPLYLSQQGKLIGLRGHDRGEQALLDSCLDLIGRALTPTTLVIVAGGSFHVVREGRGEPDEYRLFLEAKRDYYRGLPLHPAIEHRVQTTLTGNPAPFVGLHLRYSDLAHQAPFTTTIVRALRNLTKQQGVRRVFIASDSRPALRNWMQRVARMGLEPWALDASGLTGSQAALADWRLLGASQALVHFAGSSFSTEAAVAAGAWDSSIALPAHPLRKVAVRGRQHAQNGWRRLASRS